MMDLDVIIATYNRRELLGRALGSLLAAEVPPEMCVRVTVVDNNSKDDTRGVVEEWQERFDGRLGYIFEGRQGKSHALNAGIASTRAELVGMIDDDEEIDARWYTTIREAFRDPKVDFIGGACLPRWGAPPPGWLPRDYPGVIGWIDGSDHVAAYGSEYEGILMGGNAVLRREVFDRVGLYNTSLGPIGRRVALGEDQEMFDRLMAARVRGFYRPDLRIYHYVPPERLTKRYYRRWCFRNGVSLGMTDRQKSAARVAYLAGVPRWLYGKAARSLLQMAKETLSRDRDPARIFSHELSVWDLAGFFYGKHFRRTG